jgi:hypothetical protein
VQAFCKVRAGELKDGGLGLLLDFGVHRLHSVPERDYWAQEKPVGAAQLEVPAASDRPP